MRHFDDEFAELQIRLNQMASLAQSMFRMVRSAITAPNAQVDDQLAQMEEQLDQVQIEIDEEIVRLMTVYSPVASDLRNLIVMMHLTSQLERVGDQAMNANECLTLMDAKIGRPDMSSLKDIAILVGAMLDGAIGAYFDKDVELARRVSAQDHLVDAKNAQLIKDCLSDQRVHQVLEGSSEVADVLVMILLSRHLERIADQAANVCKEVVYMVEGRDVRHAPDI